MDDTENVCWQLGMQMAQHEMSTEEIVTVRPVTVAERIVEIIRDKGSPLHDGWVSWRPDEGWRVPILPVKPLS